MFVKWRRAPISQQDNKSTHRHADPLVGHHDHDCDDDDDDNGEGGDNGDDDDDDDGDQMFDKQK